MPPKNTDASRRMRQIRQHLVAAPSIHGEVALGWEDVREAFIDNYRERAELGASCCVVYEGKVVVDLWGGVRDRAPSSGDMGAFLSCCAGDRSMLEEVVIDGRGDALVEEVSAAGAHHEVDHPLKVSRGVHGAHRHAQVLGTRQADHQPADRHSRVVGSASRPLSRSCNDVSVI